MSERYEKKYKNPDLYHNRAMVHLYLENYTHAYNDLIMTDSIDPSLKAGELAKSITGHITTMIKQVKNQCSIKPKKLSQMLLNIPINMNKSSGYELTNIENHDSSKKKCILSAKIIQFVIKNVDIPVSAICVDHKGSFFVASIYNLSNDFPTKVKPGISNIVIVDPIIKKASFISNNKEYDYISVKVTDLSKVLIEGKQCYAFASSSELSSTFFA